MPLVFTLAFRNLFHDRLRFVATVIGIVFSIVLVTVQMGLYLGFGRMVTTMIDHASADLWVMPRGTKCLRGPFSAEHARALSRACHQRRGGRHSGRDRICRLANAERGDDAGFRRSARICGPAGCSRGTWWKAGSRRWRAPRRSRSTGPISIALASPGSGRPPKSGSNRCRWRPSPTASVRSPRRRSFSWTSIGRGPTRACRPERPPISSFA